MATEARIARRCAKIDRAGKEQRLREPTARALTREKAADTVARERIVDDVPMRAQLHRRRLGVRPTRRARGIRMYRNIHMAPPLYGSARGGSSAADGSGSFLEFKADGITQGLVQQTPGAWRSPIAIRCVATPISEARSVDFG